MKIIRGSYFDGRYPLAASAVLELSLEEAVLIVGGVTERFPSSQLTVSPKIGSSPCFINIPNGGQFLCRHQAALNKLRQQSPTERPIAWLEARWRVAVACVVTVAALLVSGYVFGLPRLANILVKRIPEQTERKMGEQTLAWLDQNWFERNDSPYPVQRPDIRKFFEKMCEGASLSNRHIQLEFRASRHKHARPNAYALPGDIIILTDEMIYLSQNNEEALAVLAHELGHLVLRHPIKHLLEGSVVSLIGAVVTQDAATFSTAVSSLPIVLAMTKYSRSSEQEADEFAFKLLKKTGHSPAAFAAIMERFEEKYQDDLYSPSFLSTHPMTRERIARARLVGGISDGVAH